MEEQKSKVQLEHEAKMRALELEAKELEIAEKRANVQDLKERLAEREMKRETKFMDAKTKGQTLQQLKYNDDIMQNRCNHRKGGNGVHAIIGGQGDDNQYAVLKHIFSNGDMWIRCLRCGKTWKPPLREDYQTDEGYKGAEAEYMTAVNFQTRNVTSGSVGFRFSDGGLFYRKALKNSTLR